MGLFIIGNDDLLLESGDRLILESGEDILLESSFGVVQIIDENPVLPIEYVYMLPYFFFEPFPGNFFEAVWTPAIGIQEANALMPVFDERFISGDIPNAQFLNLVLYNPGHFGADGDGDFEGPAAVDILEGPAGFEVREGV